MTPVIRTSGDTDAAFTRPPMSEARRFDVYGKLLPMERPEGELTWWQGAALLIFIAVAGLGLTLAFGS